MTEAKQLQREHEKAIADQFIVSCYGGFVFSRMGNDKNETDCIYKHGLEFLGIEITDIWYRNIDAKQEWSAVRQERKPLPIEKSWGGLLIDPQNILCNRFLQALDNKSCKEYQFPKKRMLILNHNCPQSSLTGIDDIEYCIEGIQDAIQGGYLKINNFEEIYIYFNNEFLKIYPL